jgi:hypothetical protein
MCTKAAISMFKKTIPAKKPKPILQNCENFFPKTGTSTCNGTCTITDHRQNFKFKKFTLGMSQKSNIGFEKKPRRAAVAAVMYLIQRHELQLQCSEFGSMEATAVLNAHACSFHHY